MYATSNNNKLKMKKREGNEIKHVLAGDRPTWRRRSGMFSVREATVDPKSKRKKETNEQHMK